MTLWNQQFGLCSAWLSWFLLGLTLTDGHWVSWELAGWWLSVILWGLSCLSNLGLLTHGCGFLLILMAVVSRLWLTLWFPRALRGQTLMCMDFSNFCFWYICYCPIVQGKSYGWPQGQCERALSKGIDTWTNEAILQSIHYKVLDVRVELTHLSTLSLYHVFDTS